MKMMPHDYDGKTPNHCCQDWRPYEVNTMIHGVSAPGGTLLLKEDHKMEEHDCCGMLCWNGQDVREYADSTMRLYDGVDVHASKELYRMHMPAPVKECCTPWCCTQFKFTTDVIATGNAGMTSVTDPQTGKVEQKKKKMRMVGAATMVYSLGDRNTSCFGHTGSCKSGPCSGCCGAVGPYSDVEIVNKQTG